MLPVCAVLLINNLLVPSYLLFSFTCPMIIHPSMLSQPFIADALALLVYKSTTLDKTIPSFIILIIPLQSVTHCMLFAYRSRLINCKMSARRLILLFIHNSQLNTSLVFSFAPCPTMDDGLTLTWLTWQQERERERRIFRECECEENWKLTREFVWPQENQRNYYNPSRLCFHRPTTRLEARSSPTAA